MNFRCCSLALLCGLTLPAPAVELTRGVAIVIGNSDYKHIGTLKNAAEDAQAIGERLRQLHFDLIPEQETGGQPFKNLGLTQMNGVLGDMLKYKGAGDLLVFYYAGHCAQHDSSLYLMPCDANYLSEEAAQDYDKNAVRFDSFVVRARKMGFARAIFIIDGCRNNPTEADGNERGGLFTTGDGVFVAMATTGGSPAKDGVNAHHSPMATALLSELAQPKKPVEALFESVRAQVLRDTKQQQRPVLCRDPADWENIVLNPDNPVAIAAMPPDYRLPPPPQSLPSPGLLISRKSTLWSDPQGTAQGEVWPVADGLGGTVTELTPPPDQPAVEGWKYVEIKGWAVQTGVPATDGSDTKTYITLNADGHWIVSPPVTNAKVGESLSMRHQPDSKAANTMASLRKGTVVRPLANRTDAQGRNWMQLTWRGWIQIEPTR